MTARLRALAIRVERSCARQNEGLALAAVLLAGIVLTVAVCRVQPGDDPADTQAYQSVLGCL